MIDALPLDLFGEDEPEDTTTPDIPGTATCPWCAAAVAPDVTTCPACEARILPSEPSAPTAHDGICQWCGATIAPDIDACPACGWDARGDSQVEMPGITTPLSEAQIRALYGGSDDPEPGADTAFDIAAEIIGMLLPRG